MCIIVEGGPQQRRKCTTIQEFNFNLMQSFPVALFFCTCQMCVIFATTALIPYIIVLAGPVVPSIHPRPSRADKNRRVSLP